MAVDMNIWNKYERWCRLVILLTKGGGDICKNIMSELGIKDETDGAEIYIRLKPYREKIENLGWYYQQILLPDDEIVDKNKMDISLNISIIQILDEQCKYPQIAELRKKKNQILYMPGYKRDMTEEKFKVYWGEISELLKFQNYKAKDLEIEDISTPECQKILKSVIDIITGS